MPQSYPRQFKDAEDVGSITTLDNHTVGADSEQLFLVGNLGHRYDQALTEL